MYTQLLVGSRKSPPSFSERQQITAAHWRLGHSGIPGLQFRENLHHALFFPPPFPLFKLTPTLLQKKTGQKIETCSHGANLKAPMEEGFINFLSISAEFRQEGS